MPQALRATIPSFSNWQEGEEELGVELEETLVDIMLSEEKEDEEIDGGDVGSDNDTVIYNTTTTTTTDLDVHEA